MVISLRNEKFRLVARCPLICTIIFEHIWFCIRENEILAHMVRSLINMKDEFVSRCPLTRCLIFVPIGMTPCHVNEILVYMVANLINGKVCNTPYSQQCKSYM